MEDHIPAPKLDIPTGITVDELDEELYIKWDALNNVTGYKVKITYNGKTEEHASNVNSFNLKSFNDKDLLMVKHIKLVLKRLMMLIKIHFGNQIIQLQLRLHHKLQKFLMHLIM